MLERRKSSNYLIVLQASPAVLYALLPIVRRQNIDDSKIVDLVLIPVELICSSDTALVLIEDKVPTLGLVLLRQLVCAIRQYLRICSLHCFSQFGGSMLAFEIASMRRTPSQFSTLASLGLYGEHSQSVCETRWATKIDTYRKYCQHAITEILFVASVHVVDADQEGVVHDLQAL